MNPDTNKCPNCGAEFATLTDRTTFTCGTNRHPDGSHSRTDLCREREARQKAEAEVKRLKDIILGGDFIEAGFYHTPSFQAGFDQAKWAAQNEWYTKYKEERSKLEDLYGNLKEENQKLRELLERLFSAGVGRMKIEDWRKLHAEYEQLNQLTK